MSRSQAQFCLATKVEHRTLHCPRTVLLSPGQLNSSVTYVKLCAQWGYWKAALHEMLFCPQWRSSLRWFNFRRKLRPPHCCQAEGGDHRSRLLSLELGCTVCLAVPGGCCLTVNLVQNRTPSRSKMAPRPHPISVKKARVFLTWFSWLILDNPKHFLGIP